MRNTGDANTYPIRIEDSGGVNLTHLPKRHEHYRHVGHVYVAELSNGTTKVGMTANPFKRIGQHAHQAQAYGFVIARLWVSAPHMNPMQNELALIAYGKQQGALAIRREYFEGLDFNQIVAYAENLTFDPVDEAYINSEEQRTPIFGEALWPALDAPTPTARHIDALQQAISAFFGVRSDGSRQIPMLVKPEEPNEMLPIFEQISAVKGVPLEEILSMNWVDLLESLVSSMVRGEALSLLIYARENGVRPLLETLGESFSQGDAS